MNVYLEDDYGILDVIMAYELRTNSLSLSELRKKRRDLKTRLNGNDSIFNLTSEYELILEGMIQRKDKLLKYVNLIYSATGVQATALLSLLASAPSLSGKLTYGLPNLSAPDVMKNTEFSILPFSEMSKLVTLPDELHYPIVNSKISLGEVIYYKTEEGYLRKDCVGASVEEAKLYPMGRGVDCLLSISLFDLLCISPTSLELEANKLVAELIEPIADLLLIGR